jgi:hypothetical protein
MNRVLFSKGFSFALSFAMIINCVRAFSGDIKYPCNNLKPELTKNANAIIREQEETFTIVDKGHATCKVHKVITILNKSADDEAILHLVYDKITKVSDYKCFIYDADGQQIKKVKTSEFSDVSAYNYALYSDERIISYTPVVNTYPYTLDYSYTFSYEGLLQYPKWNPQDEYDLSVEKASYKIITPSNFSFRYKEFNIHDSVIISKPNNLVTYTWSLENLPAVEYEPYSAGYISSEVVLAPNDFEIEGYDGDMRSWNEFGKFNFKLISQENILSEKTKADLKQIQSHSSSKKELLKRVYEYMQSKTRYINIVVGIGGWKPFDASFVDKNGYGDCKALSNYTKTLLKEVGIESTYTLARASENRSDIFLDFPSNQFNHAILCVPLIDDTMWLECTSQLAPCGFMSLSTHNRHVLLITPEGGKLAFIPEYRPEQNLLVRKANVTFKDISKCEAAIHTNYKGLQHDDILPIMLADAEDQKKKLYNHVDVPNVNLISWNYKENKERIPDIEETIKIQMDNYAVANGKRTFIPLNLLNKDHNVPKALKERKSDILIRYGYTDIDSIQYEIPVGYKVEFLPEKKEINSEFGKYSAEVKNEGNTVVYIRKMLFNSGKYPASKYNGLIDFKKQVSSADNIKLSLIKE